MKEEKSISCFIYAFSPLLKVPNKPKIFLQRALANVLMVIVH